MKRKCTGGKAPPGRLMEKRPATEHRRYAKISATAIDMNFSLQVAKSVLRVDGPPYKNTACSPLSIYAVLSILAAASDGQTREQLLRVMERDSVDELHDVASRLAEILEGDDDEDAPDICFADALWIADRLTLKEPFKNILRDVYKTEARAVDFVNQADQVIDEANLWAENQSKGLIKQILSRECINNDTMMILANALYFKGVWVDTFKPEDTKDDDFYLLNGDKVRAPFMRQRHSRFDYGTLEGCKVLRMLYREGGKRGEKKPSFSMYIFLPNEKDGLPNLMNSIKMDANLFKEQIELKYEQIDKLYIPKFNFECEVSLVQSMNQLGLTLPFDKVHCELTRMVDCPNKDDCPFVNAIYQKCRIETNEKGTKAAAFTRVQLACMAARLPPPPPPVDFVADHPFLFMIREDFSGAVLFIGTVLNPVSS